MTFYRKIASIYYHDMTCIHDTTFKFSRNFEESPPSCHDDEACSGVRHGYIRIAGKMPLNITI